MKLSTLPLFFSLALAAPLSYGVDFQGSLAPGKHTRYVPPISNPLFNETPYITTEIRPIYLYNEIPGEFVTQGGNITIIAAEIRVAINDRWGIIATKDGYADLQFDEALPDEQGAVNVSLGVKYAAYNNPETNSILTLGAEYEAPVGNLDPASIDLQGGGEGFIDVFVSGVTTFGRWGLQGNIGYNKALDSDHDSSMLHVSVHVDYQVTDRFYPVLELNSFSTRSNGNRLPFDFEGIDLVNFGSSDSGTVTTAAIGARYIINNHVMFGIGYEEPISHRKDLMERRYYLDAVLTF